MVAAVSPHSGRPLHTRSGQCIYNLPNWTHGFTTAIPIYGDVENVSKYISKYITKAQGAAIGGRYYYSGGKLLRPRYEYLNIDVVSLPEADYTYCVPETGGLTFSYFSPQALENIRELTI